MKELEPGETIMHIPSVASKEEHQMMVERFGVDIFNDNPIEIEVSVSVTGKKKNKTMTHITRKMNNPSKEALESQLYALSRLAEKRIENRKKEIQKSIEKCKIDYVQYDIAGDELEGKTSMCIMAYPEDECEDSSIAQEIEIGETEISKLKQDIENRKRAILKEGHKLIKELNFLDSNDALIEEVKNIRNKRDGSPSEMNEILHTTVKKIEYGRPSKDTVVLSLYFK